MTTETWRPPAAADPPTDPAGLPVPRGYERRPHLRFMLICGLLGFLFAGLGFFVGCAVEPKFQVPNIPGLPKLPELPSRPNRPSLPSGFPSPPSFPSLPSLPELPR